MMIWIEMTFGVMLRFLIMLIHLLVIMAMLSSRSQTMFGTMPMLSGFDFSFLLIIVWNQTHRLCSQAEQALLAIIMTDHDDDDDR